MMTTSDPCDVVVERIALGEPLADLTGHLSTCDACRQLTSLPAALGATHRDSEPAAGFSARMMVGAQERIVTRRRRRVAGAACAAVAATAILAFALTRDTRDAGEKDGMASATQLASESPTSDGDDVPDDHDDHDVPVPAVDNGRADPAHEDLDDDVRALVQLADTKRSRRASARWQRIEQPLEPYRILLAGETP